MRGPIMVLAVEFRLLFSFRALASPVPARPQAALRPLAVHQADQQRLDLLFPFHLVLRPPLRPLAMWLEVAERQVVHVLSRLVLRQDLHQ